MENEFIKIDNKSIFDNCGLIENVVINLNKLTVTGVSNMVIVIDAIQKLNSLKQALENEEKAKNDQDQ
jgi:hypothetical protein